MLEYVIPLLIAVFASTGLFTFIQFLITRHDNHKKEDQNKTVADINLKLNNIDNKLDKLQIDSVRTQLMLLIKSYPGKVNEILVLAYKYFVVLKGDTYMTSLFSDWLDKKNMEKPDWFQNIHHDS